MLFGKTLSLILLITFVIAYKDLLLLLPQFVFYFTVFLIFFVLAFHYNIMNFLFWFRDSVIFRIGSIISRYDRGFRDKGGIEGFKRIEEKHIAIVFPEINEKVYPNVKSKELRMFYDYMTKNKQQYKIYKCVHCKDFENIVNSEYVTGLHIFGHGSISHLTFKDGVVYYREFYGLKPKKESVCQWHCNIGKYKNIHLGHIAERYYVPVGYRHFLNNGRDIKKLVEGKLDWTINTN